MSEVHITPREEMLAAVQATHPELVPKVEKELTFMALKDDIDGKGSGLDKMYWIWKKRTGQCGNANEIHSWTAYALGLTSKKPDDWKKFVELRRAFARAGFPDIDSDFVSAGRDRVIDHIVDKYGRERVGNIGTWAMLSLKAATKRAVKVFDLAGSYHKGSKAFTTDNELLSREISASLKPYKRGAVMVAVDDDGVEHPIKTTRDAYNFCPDFKAYMDKNPEMMKNLDHIEGLLSQFGCVASDTPILTQKGWVRIDQLDKSCKIGFLDSKKELLYSDQYRAFKTGIKPTYRMKLSDGNFVDITDEHLVFTDLGCVRFEEIRKDPKKYKVLSIHN